jgi:tetratricopeptide (TPR) repeat protein
MTRSYRNSAGVLAAGIWLAAATGCHQLPPAAHSDVVKTDSGEKTPSLNGHQVADIQASLGRSLERKGQIDEALAAYGQALKQDPNNGDVCLRMAILYDRQGQFNKAQEFYQMALASRPGNPDIYCDRGYSLYLQHCWTEAEMNLRQAIAVQPGHARAHDNLGLLLAHTGRGPEALVEFCRAGCSEADAQVNLAFALTLDRRWAEARKHYEEALASEPSSEHAKKGLEELNALVSKAAVAHDDFVAAAPSSSSANPKLMQGNAPVSGSASEVKRATLLFHGDAELK